MTTTPWKKVTDANGVVHVAVERSVVAPLDQDRCSCCTRHGVSARCGSDEFDCSPNYSELDFYWRTEHDAILLRMGVKP